MKITKTVLVGTSALFCSLSQVSAITVLLGDQDNFALGGASNTPPTRTSFGTALTYETNNRITFSGVQKGFDNGNQNRVFGATFTNITNLDLSSPVTLRLALQSTDPDTDSIGFQFNDSTLPSSTPTGSYFPQMLWGQPINDFVSANSTSGALTSGVTLEIDLRTLTSTGLGTNNLAESINSLGYLDVIVQDDTQVDFLELTYNVNTVPEPSVSISCIIAACGLMARRRRK